MDLREYRWLDAVGRNGKTGFSAEPKVKENPLFARIAKFLARTESTRVNAHKLQGGNLQTIGVAESDFSEC